MSTGSFEATPTSGQGPRLPAEGSGALFTKPRNCSPGCVKPISNGSEPGCMKILYIANDRHAAEVADFVLRGVAPNLALAWLPNLADARRWIR